MNIVEERNVIWMPSVKIISVNVEKVTMVMAMNFVMVRIIAYSYLLYHTQHNCEGYNVFDSSVSPSIVLSVHIQFSGLFFKMLADIDKIFVIWVHEYMSYRSSLIFILLWWFLPKLQALNLAKFTEIIVFRTFFLNACRYLHDFWYISLPW